MLSPFVTVDAPAIGSSGSVASWGLPFKPRPTHKLSCISQAFDFMKTICHLLEAQTNCVIIMFFGVSYALSNFFKHYNGLTPY